MLLGKMGLKQDTRAKQIRNPDIILFSIAFQLLQKPVILKNHIFHIVLRGYVFFSDISDSNIKQSQKTASFYLISSYPVSLPICSIFQANLIIWTCPSDLQFPKFMLFYFLCQTLSLPLSHVSTQEDMVEMASGIWSPKEMTKKQ